MQVPLRNMQGEIVGEVELRDDIFGVPLTPATKAVMHQALLRQLANARLGTHDTKTRGEVAGGGRKIWRQKGTGRARQGSIRAPHWRHGGVVFGPHPRSYAQKMPRKMRRLALRAALSAKAADQQIVVLDELALEAPKTRQMLQVLGALKLDSSVLILLPAKDTAVELSARNLPQVKTLLANYLNVRDLLGYDYVLMPKGSLAVIESILGQ
ncbi:MAG: 50S ribosomal protein L4 [Anaerolineae bacterium]|nr:50S ribosomal protein L4 [Anaerolineae bacterium]